jgi:hypothetical protein
MPEKWNIPILITLFKREDTANVNNYRKINFLCTVYKIYGKNIAEELED